MTEKTILLGERYRARLESALRQYGFYPIWLPDNPALDPRLASHADLSVFAAEDTLILSREYLHAPVFVNLLTNTGAHFIFSEKQQYAGYPYDAGLCALKMGRFLMHNRKHCDPAILNRYKDDIIHVNQTYTRCTACPIGTNAMITADHGIARAARNHDIEVLEIQTGGFELEGFNTGFIGGSAFSSQNELYFTGTLDRHPDKLKIVRFLRDHSFSPVFLTSYPAFDIGGAFVLKNLA